MKRQFVSATSAVMLAWSGVVLGAANPSNAIFVMQVDGSAVRQVAAVDGFKFHAAPRFSHDGKLLAFAAMSDRNASRLFAIGTDGKNLQELGDGAMPDWSPDDKQLAFQMGSPDGAGETVWVQNADGTGRARVTDGSAPHWSPDGSQIALIGKSLRLFDIVESTQRDVFEGEQSRSTPLAFDWSPDGKRLAAVIERNGATELVIVNINGADMRVKSRLRANVRSVAWSPNADILAVGIEDDAKQQQLYLLKSEGNQPPTLIAGQEEDNRGPAWSPDGKQLAFASSRKTAAMPAVALRQRKIKLELVRSHDTGSPSYSLALTPDGQMVLVGGGLFNRRSQLWDMRGDTVRNFSYPATSVAMSPDGRRGVGAIAPGASVAYFNLSDGSLIREFALGAQPVTVQFSPDGSKVAATSFDNSACVFNVESGEQVARVQHPDKIFGVQWSTDSRLIGVTCSDKHLYIWEVSTGRKVQQMAHTQVPYPLAFSQDGTRVLTGCGGELVGNLGQMNFRVSEDNPYCVWDLATGKLIRETKGHKHVIFGVAVSSNGKYVATSSFDRSLRLWDAEQGIELARVDGQGWVTKAAFSPDGTHLLATGGMIKAFNVIQVDEFPNERLRLFRIIEE